MAFLPDVPIQEGRYQQIFLIIITKLDDEAKVRTPSADVVLRDHVPKWQVCNIYFHK